MISDILEENVVQPLLVSMSMMQLATETVRSIMKIDDIVRELLNITNISSCSIMIGQLPTMTRD